MTSILPNGREISDDDPIMLRDAAALAFPDGSVGERALRRMRDKGHLDCSRVAGKDFTTLAAVRLMLERSRIAPKRPAAVRVPRRETEAEMKAKGEIALASLLASCRPETVPGRPRGKQARKPQEPPPKAKTRKRQLLPRVSVTGASEV